MSASYCNVALPVPLRTTFTYGVPEALRAQLQPGSRVLVPFRKKSMVGMVLEMTDALPEGTTIRDVSKLIDLVPALTPKLLELGRWIAGYYLAPIGEVFRAMTRPRSCKNSAKTREPGRLVRRPSWEFRPRDCSGSSGAVTCKFRRRCRGASARRNALSRGRARARKESRLTKRKSGCGRCCKPNAARCHCRNS